MIFMYKISYAYILKIYYLCNKIFKYERYRFKPPRAPITGQTTQLRIP